MQVYRITLKKWSTVLTGSGYPGRWNSKGKFVIYTSATRALASLENIVHRSGEGLNQNFKTMVVEVPENIKIESIRIEDLKQNWYEFKNFRYCQSIGDEWLDRKDSAILKVPSAIIKEESNYLLNPQHPDFTSICIIRNEDFNFDPRIKT